MNWAGLVVSAGIVFLGFYMLPYGALLLLALTWVWRKS